MSNKVIYKKYITSKEWKEKKEKVFDLRGKECEQCGHQNRLHVHHLTYENLGDEKMEDLQILCFQCHMSKHDEHFERLILKNPTTKIKPLKEGEIRLTREHLDNLRTSKGGICKHVYRLFGYKLLPKTKGWFKSLINKNISEKDYLDTVQKIREWEFNRDSYEAPLKKKTPENKTLKHSICNELRRKGINTINGSSISYMDLITLKKLHSVYCD